MSATIVRHRLANVLVVLGLLVAALSVMPRADALGGEFRAATPAALSVLLSQHVVENGQAEAFLIAPDDRPEDLLGVGAALGALPGQASLLLTTRGALTPAVASEVDRIRNAATVAYVIGDGALAQALEARGLTVNLVVGNSPTELAVALAIQTFGVAAGTGQRVIAVGPDQRAAGLANTLGANLGIPVIPVSGSWAAEAFLRQVIVIASPETVADGAVTSAGTPTVNRIWPGPLDGLGVALGEALAAEPKEGDLQPRAGTAVIGLDDEANPFPALLAPVAAAAFALDGLDATVRVQPRGTSYAALAGDDPVIVLGLTAAGGPSPASNPLPATGGGLAIGAVLAVAGIALRRR